MKRGGEKRSMIEVVRPSISWFIKEDRQAGRQTDTYKQTRQVLYARTSGINSIGVPSCMHAGYPASAANSHRANKQKKITGPSTTRVAGICQ